MKKLMMVMAAMLPLVMMAQEFKMTWGPDYKKADAFGVVDFIGATATDYYVLLQPYRKHEMLRFNMQHQLVSNKGLEFKVNNEDAELATFVATKHYHYADLTYEDRKTKTIETYFQKLDDKGNFEGEPQKVASTSAKNTRIAWDGITHFGSSINNNANGVFQNPDQTLLLMVNSGWIVEKNGKAKLSLNVFDEKLNAKWAKEVELPYPDNKLWLQWVRLLNDGTVVMTAKLYQTEHDKKTRALGYKFKVFVISPDGFKESEIDLGEGKAPQSAGLFDEEEGRIAIAGIYQSTYLGSDDRGIYGGLVDAASGKIMALTIQDYSDQTKDSIIQEKGKLKNIKAFDFISLANGNKLMIADENYDVMLTRGEHIYVYYHSDYKVLVGFDKNMKVRFDSVHASNLTSGLSEPTGIANYRIDDNRFLMFYNNTEGFGNDFRVALFNENGKLLKEDRINIGSNSYLLPLDRIFQIAPNKFIILIVEGREYKAGILEVVD
ncbi:MAG: hypothetical protein U0T75_02680 [Chitinophagales bacterium]